MRILLLLLCAFAQVPAPAPTVPADWKTYESAALGFRFQYPDSMEIHEVVNPGNPDAGPQHIVDLRTRDIDPQRPYLGPVYLLRVAVWDRTAQFNQRMRSYYEKQPGYKAITVGGRAAGQYLDRNSLSRIGHWQIIVYGVTQEVRIFTMDPDETSKEGPDDTHYPFLKIIGSFAFAPPFPK